jgi:hypothetical protein
VNQQQVAASHLSSRFRVTRSRQRLSRAVYAGHHERATRCPGAASLSRSGLCLWGNGRAWLLKLLLLGAADRAIMIGPWHRCNRTVSVAEAIAAHRPCQQTTESDMFAGADHKKLRVLRLAHKNLARVPAHELQHPIRMRGHRLEHRSDRVSAGVRGLPRCGFCRFDRYRNICGGEPVRPIERMHGSQHCACAFRMLCCPLQSGLTRRRVVQPHDDVVADPAPPRAGTTSNTPDGARSGHR